MSYVCNLVYVICMQSCVCNLYAICMQPSWSCSSPQVTQNGRVFADGWHGVCPSSMRPLTSVHARAVGAYRTALGPTRAFPMDVSMGIGCILAPVSSGPFTSLLARLIQTASPGFRLRAPAGYVVDVAEKLFADDLGSSSSLTRIGQLHVDLVLHGLRTENLVPGHDTLEASKSAMQWRELYGRSWAMNMSKLFFGTFGPGDDEARTRLAMALSYTYLGLPLNASLSHAAKEIGGIEKLEVVFHLLPKIATGGVSYVSAVINQILRGGLDVAAAATTYRASSCARLDQSARRVLTRLGHRLALSSVLLSHLPLHAGGQGVEPSSPTTRGILAASCVRNLRGRDGEPARAVAEAHWRTGAIRNGFDPVVDGDIINFSLTAAYAPMAHEVLIFDNVALSMREAGLALRRGDDSSQSALNPQADLHSPAARLEQLELGCLIWQLPDVPLSSFLSTRGVRRVGHLHAGRGALMGASEVASTYGEPGFEFNDTDLKETRRLLHFLRAHGLVRAQLEEWKLQSVSDPQYQQPFPEVAFARWYADEARARVRRVRPLVALGWRHVGDDDIFYYEAKQLHAEPDEWVSLSFNDLRSHVMVQGWAELDPDGISLSVHRGDAAASRLGAALAELQSEGRHEPRCFADHLNESLGLPRADALRRLAYGPGEAVGAGEATIELNRALLEDYAPLKRHRVDPAAHNLVEARANEAGYCWTPPSFATDFPTVTLPVPPRSPPGTKPVRCASADLCDADLAAGLTGRPVSPPSSSPRPSPFSLSSHACLYVCTPACTYARMRACTSVCARARVCTYLRTPSPVQCPEVEGEVEGLGRG